MEQLLSKLLSHTSKGFNARKYTSLLTTGTFDSSYTLTKLQKNEKAYLFYKEHLPESDILLAEFCMKYKQICRKIDDFLVHLALFPNVYFEGKRIRTGDESIFLNISDEERRIIEDILRYKEMYLLLKNVSSQKSEEICKKYEEIVFRNESLLNMYIELKEIYFIFDNLCSFNGLGLEIQLNLIRNCYLSNEFSAIDQKINILELNENCLMIANQEMALHHDKNLMQDQQNNLYIKKYENILHNLNENLKSSIDKEFIRNSLLMDENLIYSFQLSLEKEKTDEKNKFIFHATKQFKKIKDTVLFNRSDFIQTLFILLRDSAYKNRRSFFYILENAYHSCFKKFTNKVSSKQNLDKILDNNQTNLTNEKLDFENEQMNLDIQIEEKENLWNYITLIPQVKYPLNLFITSDEVNKMVFIFKILYRIKKTENHLTTLRLKNRNMFKLQTIKFTDFILRLNSHILLQLIEVNYKKYHFKFINKIKLFFNEKKLGKMLVSIEDFCINVSKNRKFEYIDTVKEFIESIEWGDGVFFNYCKWYLEN